MHFLTLILLITFLCNGSVTSAINPVEFADEKILRFEEFLNQTVNTTETEVWRGFRLNLNINILQKLCLIKPLTSLDTNKLNFVFLTKMENITIPLNNLSALMEHPEFIKNNQITILVTGWLTTLRGNRGSDRLFDAYKIRENINFIILDTSDYLDTLYNWAAIRTVNLGSALGKALITLKKNFPKSVFHLLGHSLGAHVIAEAGRTFYKETGSRLPHLTGLDPAKPCFEKDDWLKGLQLGDAEFIDVIHTNTVLLGQFDPCGDADFYPNVNEILQPGCSTFSCSHFRAIELYAETVNPDNTNIFPSMQCYSLDKLNKKDCKTKNITMGYGVQKTAKGLFYLETSGASPFTLK